MSNKDTRSSAISVQFVHSKSRYQATHEEYHAQEAILLRDVRVGTLRLKG